MFIFKKAKTKLGGKSCTLGGKQFVFRKARTPDQTLNDLDAYISGLGDEPVKWLAREVRSWGEFSYAEIESAIADGRLNELIDWQNRYAEVINNTFAPMWATAMAAAALKATKGKVILSDSDKDVKDWIRTHGGELISRLSDESKRAIAEIILRAQSTNLFSPREIAQQIRPLIGLTTQQANANFNYRQRIYQRYINNGASQSVASRNADQAARRYASSQHRYRAETITHTELAFAYNRGANIGVQRAIRQGLMGRCAMIWSTAGTNRVCSRCLALKDTVVGYTDESGVTLPPLHPRCRCTIIYDEIGTPQADKPLTSPASSGNVASGALNDKNDPDGKRRQKHADTFYEGWRNSKKEFIVKRLARNSGMREKAIDTIFDHVFITKHDLYIGHCTFPPDYDMSESFRRLSEGKNIQSHDLLLLKHEWLEAHLMKRYGYDYDTAHRITERKYNYKAALIEWYRRRGLSWNG